MKLKGLIMKQHKVAILGLIGSVGDYITNLGNNTTIADIEIGDTIIVTKEQYRVVEKYQYYIVAFRILKNGETSKSNYIQLWKDLMSKKRK